jgi:hypothetical protein
MGNPSTSAMGFPGWRINSFVEWFATSCDHGSRLAWSGLMAYGLWIMNGSSVTKFQGSSVDQAHTALTIR